MIDAMTMERRTMLGHMAMLLGVASLPAEALAAKPGKRKAPRLLSPVQFAAFSAIADTIIPATDTPGAVGAGVPRLFDRMLTRWASPASKIKLIGAIEDINKAAMAADKKGFAALTPARRKELLLAYDSAALKPGPVRTEKLNAFEAMMAGPPVMNPGWVKLKGLVINLYYNTEVAMTKELIYEHVPGKWVPSFKVTPETRPFAAGGPF